MIELPSQTIFYTIEKAIKEYRRFAQRNLNEAVGDITIDQALLLIFLHNHPKLSQNEIGELIFKDNASVTRMIELMVKKEYLARSVHQNDRRRYQITFTDKGQQTISRLGNSIPSNRASALSDVSDREIVQLRKTLTKIINNCNASHP